MLIDANFTGAQFDASTNLTDIILSNAIFDLANLSEVNLTDTNPPDGLTLTSSSFRGANMTGFSGEDVNLAGADFSANANGTRTQMGGASLEDSELNSANLTQVIAEGISLPGADLSNAIMVGADLSNANLAGTILVDANLTGGVELDNAFIEKSNVAGANFTGANLTGANLKEAVGDNLTNFTNANLTGASLEVGSFIGSNFTNANLTNANLVKANFTDATMVGANLTGVNAVDVVGLTLGTGSNDTLTGTGSQDNTIFLKM